MSLRVHMCESGLPSVSDICQDSESILALCSGMFSDERTLFFTTVYEKEYVGICSHSQLE